MTAVPTKETEQVVRPQGVRIDATGLGLKRGSAGKSIQILTDVSFTILPGELVAIVGGSGSGKTSLLNTIAGVHMPTTGSVTFNGQDLYQNLAHFRKRLGYVPQDDIVHRELTTASTLDYAARLRLPAGTPREERRLAVERSLQELRLTDQADQAIGSLSGGQRKRASIGVELLTRPQVFFLDEPTSGLDPANDREMMRNLRQLSIDEGSTIVITTHAPQDVDLCDRVLFIHRGFLAFYGTPQEALTYFGAKTYEEIYERVEIDATPQEWGQRYSSRVSSAANDTPTEPGSRLPAPQNEDRQGIGSFRQWLVLTQRHFDILLRNRLTLGILAGSPIGVIAMFLMLFRPGAFNFQHPDPPAVLQIIYWLAFAAFFFGLTYGLLDIATEMAIFRRERLVNLRIVPYVLSKLAVLAPILAAVLLADLVVLRILDRLPSASLDVYSEVLVTAILCGVAAIALGLLASAAVTDPVQVTLALPMLCWPQVLFGGGMLAVPAMATAGKTLSYVTSARWGFEGIGKSLDVNALFGSGNSNIGAALLSQYGDSFSRELWQDWLILGASAAVCLLATCFVLARKSGH